MKFAEFKIRGDQELRELLAEQRAELHALQVKARTREIKQVHKIAVAKRTIARILTVLKMRTNEPAKIS